MDQLLNFSAATPIYIQIGERLCDEIISGNYPEESRVPGVREYSVQLEVNVNTTTKAYDRLAQQNIIYQKRGMGYFVKSGARELILSERKHQFMQHTMPQIKARMQMLGITHEEIMEILKGCSKN